MTKLSKSLYLEMVSNDKESATGTVSSNLYEDFQLGFYIDSGRIICTGIEFGQQETDMDSLVQLMESSKALIKRDVLIANRYKD